MPSKIRKRPLKNTNWWRIFRRDANKDRKGSWAWQYLYTQTWMHTLQTWIMKWFINPRHSAQPLYTLLCLNSLPPGRSCPPSSSVLLQLDGLSCLLPRTNYKFNPSSSWPQRRGREMSHCVASRRLVNCQTAEILFHFLFYFWCFSTYLLSLLEKTNKIASLAKHFRDFWQRFCTHTFLVDFSAKFPNYV